MAAPEKPVADEARLLDLLIMGDRLLRCGH